MKGHPGPEESSGRGVALRMATDVQFLDLMARIRLKYNNQMECERA